MIEKTIKEALFYAKTHLGLQEEDAIYVENLLLHHFGAAVPFEGEIDEKAIASYRVPDVLIHDFVTYLVEEKKMDEGAAERDAIWVMGILTPLPSEVDRHFAELYRKDPSSATDYLYDLSIKNDYIAKTMVDKNILWKAHFAKGSDLEISINLSKPEKNNKDIAKLVGAKATGYPKCLLCQENIGFEGSPTHPARENIRFIPLTLAGEKWFMQYSPYVYYHQHCIVFYEKHVPMEVSEKNLAALLDFVDLFPHFFIGSNSDLPIVGGSILNHEHFQGGEHLLPLLLAPDKEKVGTFHGVEVSIVDFYVTCLKFKASTKEAVLEEAAQLVKAWKAYEDLEHDILAHDENGAHSTCTPFARKVDGGYVLYLCLRNNRCTKEYPDGLFHAHPEFHHIKKEGIGLIEAAGLFILPARLLRQAKEVEDALGKKLTNEQAIALYPDLSIFTPMMDEMRESGETSECYINKVCQGILRNVAVYKDDEKGQAGLRKFLKEAL